MNARAKKCDQPGQKRDQMVRLGLRAVGGGDGKTWRAFVIINYI
jgi:hypothetical protein